MYFYVLSLRHGRSNCKAAIDMLRADHGSEEVKVHLSVHGDAFILETTFVASEDEQAVLGLIPQLHQLPYYQTSAQLGQSRSVN